MIYSNNLEEMFQQAGIKSYSDALVEYIQATFLTPNDLNVNRISLDFIVANKNILQILVDKLTPDIISSNIEDMFISLFDTENEELRANFLFASKTKFLQLLVASFIYGLIMELKDTQLVKSKGIDFHL